MNLVNRFAGGMWLTNSIWFALCPQMYVDEEGIALDGYPLMLAKSFELSKMYNGDFSWMQDPYNRKIPITFMTFIDTAINITIGGFVHRQKLPLSITNSPPPLSEKLFFRDDCK